MGAHASCDLPRDRRQIYNMKQCTFREREVYMYPPSIPRNDTLACIMQLCKDSSSTSSAFIRLVEAAPEPMCVLCTNQ